MSNHQRAEDCRFAVRKILFARPTASLPVDAIMHQSTRMGDDYTTTEIHEAAEFLTGLGQVNRTISSMGSTLRYQITAVGILAYERNE